MFTLTNTFSFGHVTKYLFNKVTEEAYDTKDFIGKTKPLKERIDIYHFRFKKDRATGKGIRLSLTTLLLTPYLLPLTPYHLTPYASRRYPAACPGVLEIKAAGNTVYIQHFPGKENAGLFFTLHGIHVHFR